MQVASPTTRTRNAIDPPGSPLLDASRAEQQFFLSPSEPFALHTPYLDNILLLQRSSLLLPFLLDFPHNRVFTIKWTGPEVRAGRLLRLGYCQISLSYPASLQVTTPLLPHLKTLRQPHRSNTGLQLSSCHLFLTSESASRQSLLERLKSTLRNGSLLRPSFTVARHLRQHA
jgi:hypothetical protein